MADESLLVNGGGEDQAADSFFDMETPTTKVSDLVQKVEVLEREKAELVKENQEVKERAKKVGKEVLGLRNEKVEMEGKVRKAEEDGKVLEAIAARAAELETDVARLQHDLGSAMSEGVEAKDELQEARKVLEERTVSLGNLKREKELLEQGFWSEIEDVKKAKGAVESRVEELESRVRAIREEAKTELDVKENESKEWKMKFEMVEAVVAKVGGELVKERAEKSKLQEEVQASEEKVKELEAKLIQLQKKAEEAEKLISGLKESTVEAVNGVLDRDVFADERSNKKGLINSQWAATAGAGAMLVAGVVCVHYARRR